MMTTFNRPSAAAGGSVDRLSEVSPETKAARDEPVKQLLEMQEIADEHVERPPDVEAGRDERVKWQPREAELRPAVPPEVHALLGPPPLLPGEEGAAYESLLLAVAAAVKPKDILEWLFVQDIAASTWAEQRLRRLQMCLLADKIQSGLRDHLQRAFRAAGKSSTDSEKLAAAAATALITNDQATVAATTKALREPVDAALISARALRDMLEVYTTLDRLITTASIRRQAVSREIERRRETLARRWRLEHVFR